MTTETFDELLAKCPWTDVPFYARDGWQEQLCKLAAVAVKRHAAPTKEWAWVQINCDHDDAPYLEEDDFCVGCLEQIVPSLRRKLRRLGVRKADIEDAVHCSRAWSIAESDSMRECSGGDIVAQAMRAFRGYHTAPVIEPRPDGIGLHDTNLLFYYQNRLAAHGLGWSAQDAGAPEAGRMGRQP